ncbi:ABC transporter permease [Paenibacillus sp. NPDC057934]|uniref:ABC transporter permease n=1 Tax=Paenibacillus sp. NPDC057934 TaxID=3346282 RepID=UPI0036DAE769
MIKYLRIYKTVWKVSLIADMSHRVNFFTRIFSGILYLLTGLGMYVFVYTKLDTLGGWSFGDMLIFLGTTFLVDLLWMTFFFFNLLGLPTLINKGEFDMLLLKPVNSQFLAVMGNVNLDSFFNSIIGVALVVYGVNLNNYSISFIDVLLYIGLLVNGVLLFYSTFLMINCIAFWQTRFQFAWDLIEWFYEFAMRPDFIYKGGVRVVLTFIIPALMLVNIPAKMLMDRFNFKEVGFGFLLTTLFFILSQWVWKKAISNYSSASS